MKQSCIEIPRGWQRVIKSQTVIYITPSQDELKSKDDILQYLTSPGTCKCGLKCPLHLDSLFSFDAAIRSKEDREQCNIILDQDEKLGKHHSVSKIHSEITKGPPVSHSCILKTVQKENTVKTVTQRPSSDKADECVPDVNTHLPVQNCTNSPMRPRQKQVHRPTTPVTTLPPISVFCQVNSYTVHQILQLLYSSLENATSKHQQHISTPNLGQRMNSPIQNELHHSKPSSNVSSANSSPTLAEFQRDGELIMCAGDRQRLQLNRNQQPRTKPDVSQSKIKSEVPCHIEGVFSQAYKHKINSFQGHQSSEPPTNSPGEANKRNRAKPVKRPGGNMLQIVQNSPVGQMNKGNYPPPHYMLQNRSMRVVGPNSRTPNVKISSQHMYVRLPQHYNDMPYYNRQQGMYMPPGPYLPPPPTEVAREDANRSRPNKSRSKKLCPQSKQPSIIIQPDSSRIRLDGTSKPALLVSLGDDKKTPKLVPKKQSPTANDANLTSVDSILKTCANPNLGNIPDIDNDTISEPFPKGRIDMSIPKKPPEQQKVAPTNNTPNTTVQYSSMIPVQYLTPGSLIYGVPLVQPEKPTRESKTKSSEKWEGVLSPSEVDAKVQQILSSPQKGEESQSDKDSSPKKRKRQQSAPHMFDRYPGNPALRFGQSAKVPKLSKSEPQTPSNSASVGSQNIQHAPGWTSQFQNAFHHKAVHMLPGEFLPDSSASQSDGKKNR